MAFGSGGGGLPLRSHCPHIKSKKKERCNSAANDVEQTKCQISAPTLKAGLFVQPRPGCETVAFPFTAAEELIS